jgi:eukaryotic-like serine/threonine-protein kinase
MTQRDGITPQEWPLVKALWFAAQDAAADERSAILNAPDVDPIIRAHVERLLRAAEASGDRFEQPAAVALPPVSDEHAAPTLVGRRVGPFTVRRRIGQGGMGVVYEAARSDAAYEQRVAVKTIWRGVDSAVLLKRFRTERQILAVLEHPNIARLLDGGATEEGTPWLAMEYVDGAPIDVYCDDARLGLDARLDLFRQVCAAVQYAHDHKVVHRDLKPSNVLVTADGTVKLLDFGVAKLVDDPDREGTLTGAGLSPFTAAYAAPEQVSGGVITPATDVYALGALLVTLLVGRPPLLFQSLAMVELMQAIREQPARAPSLLALDGDGAASTGSSAREAAVERGFTSREHLAKALHGELDAIALMALRKEPERRYASAAALADDVHRYLRRQQVSARPDTLEYRARTFARRRRPVVLAALASAAVFAAAGGWSWWQGRKADREHEVAAERLREVRTLASALVFDASDRLQDVPGATEARSALMKTALVSLDRASTDAPRDAALLRELALAYQRAGDLLGNPTNANLGDMAGATAAYKKAIVAAETAMEIAPDSVNSMWTLALVYEKAADLEAPSGKVRDALEHQRASLALFRRVAGTDTARLRYLRALGISSMKLGDLLGHPMFTNAGDTAAAITAYEEANARLERAAQRGDTTFALARHLAIVRERTGRLMQERGDFPQAAAWLDRSLRVRDSLVRENPSSVEARRDLAIAYYLKCGLHLAERQPQRALPLCERSLAIRRVLLREDPKDSRFIRGMGIMHRRLGEIHVMAGNPARALRDYSEAAAYYERFFAGRAGAINDRRDFAATQVELASIATSMGMSAVARSSRISAEAALDSVAARTTLTASDSALLLRVKTSAVQAARVR